MAEDSSSPEKIQQLDDRLNNLESIARETIARLYAIETRLGLVFRAVPRELDQHEREAQVSRLRAVEDALKSTARSKKTAAELRRAPDSKPQGQTPSEREQIGQSGIEPVAERPRAIENPELSGQPAVTQPPASGEPARLDAPPSAVFSEAAIVRPAPTAIHPVTPATRADQMRQTQTSHAREAEQTSPDLEARIGGRWLLWIGIIAIAFGMAFFLKFAFDNQWITPGWRVNIGVAIGLGFLMGAERLRARYPIYANGLSGGGIIILYLSIFVGFNTYRLIPQLAAFVLMAAVTATASLLAARYSALPIAILSLIGGFLTPILLSTGVDNEAGLFGYIALLDLGVLALAYSKHWRSLNYMAFTATVAMFAAWMISWYTPEKLLPTIFFLTLFFVIFAVLAVLHNVVNRRQTLWIDLAMVFSNALLYFSTSYELLDDNHHGILGLFAVLVSAFYLCLGYFTHGRDREDSLLIYTFLALAFLFAVLAVPIQLDQHWVTMGWALEGAAMTWIGLRTNDRTSRYAAVIVFSIAVAHWFYVDVQEFAYHASESFSPLLNRRALSCAVLVGALAAGAACYKRLKTNVEDDERSMFIGLYLLTANTLAVILLSIDANDYFEQAKAASGADHVMSVTNTKALTLTALWAMYGVGTLFVGVTRKLKPLRLLGLLLLAGATVKVLVVDLNFYAAQGHTIIVNQTFAALALVVIALALGAWFYARSRDVDDEERDVVLPLLIGVANVLAIIALSSEALGHFDRAQAVVGSGEGVQLENTKQLVLSAVWTIYGAAGLIIGIRRRWIAVRVGALSLLAMATIKVVVVDLQYYKADWHTLLANSTFAAFALLIIAFAAGAWCYTHAEDISDNERAVVIPILVGAANLLAVVALSAEAIGYFEQAKARAGNQSSIDISRLANKEQFALTVLWTLYGGAALIIGIKRRFRMLRLGALMLLAVAIFKLLIVDLKYYRAPWHTLIFNETFAAFALIILALASSVWFYSRAEDIDEDERTALIPFLVCIVNLLAIGALSTEVLGYFGKNMRQAGVTVDDLRGFRLARQLWLSLVWAIYGGVMLTVGIARRNKLPRIMALLLLGLTIFKVFLFDLSSLEKLYRIISFIVLGAILMAVSFLYQRYRQRMLELIGDKETPEPMSAE